MADRPAGTGGAQKTPPGGNMRPAAAQSGRPQDPIRAAAPASAPAAGMPRTTAGGTAPAGAAQTSSGAGMGPSAYQSTLNAQFGQGNPYGMQNWYGGNPLETAATMAQRAYDRNIAGIHERYAGGGTANSARQGIAEGTALGEFGAGLGDVLASRGQAARASDADRGLQALLGAGQQDLGARQLALQANQQLGGYGTGLTGIGAQETDIPNLAGLLSLLGTFSRTTGTGMQKQNSSGGKLK